MSGRGGWLPPVGVALLAAGFAYLNRAEKVQVELGLVDFYASSALVILAAFLLGMTAMLLFGLRQDLRLREELRARGLLDGAAPASAAPPASSPSAGTKQVVEPDPAARVDPHGVDSRDVAPHEVDSHEADPHDAGFARPGAVTSSDDRTDAEIPGDRTLLHPNPTRDDPSPA
jgi:uncharacterized integral membrane protein